MFGSPVPMHTFTREEGKHAMLVSPEQGWGGRYRKPKQRGLEFCCSKPLMQLEETNPPFYHPVIARLALEPLHSVPGGFNRTPLLTSAAVGGRFSAPVALQRSNKRNHRWERAAGSTRRRGSHGQTPHSAFPELRSAASPIWRRLWLRIMHLSEGGGGGERHAHTHARTCTHAHTRGGVHVLRSATTHQLQRDMTSRLVRAVRELQRWGLI